MKRLICIILSAVIALSCAVTGASAGDVSEYPGYNPYTRYAVTLNMAGMPSYIKASFDYDRDFVDIYPDYPGYNGTGINFTLTREGMGGMYSVNYTVEDTLITYEYTLNEGFTLDDFLRAVKGSVMRPEDSNNFVIFDIAMKLKQVVPAQITESKILDVVTADGTVLYKDGEKLGYCGSQCIGHPLENLDPVVYPTEPNDYKYRDKLLSQYGLTKDKLTSYEEVYEHKDGSGDVDWAIVRAAAEPRVNSLYTSPRFYVFGNRVLQTEDAGEPFSFNIGVFSVKHDRFIELYEPEIYDCDEITEVWTEIGEGRLLGDMDGDNDLTITDATLIQRVQADMDAYPKEDEIIPVDYVSDEPMYYSDFDWDGERSIADATAIQRFLAGMTYHAGWRKPQPVEPDPTEPVPTEPQPTEPEPTEPAPTEADDGIPRIVGFRSTPKGVEITVGAVPGAKLYRYYYKNSKGGWTKMAETAATAYTDTDVKVGATYTYTVRCVDENGEFTSDFVREGWEYTYDPILDTPKITKCEAVSDGVEITWGAVEGAQLYRVYYKGSKGWTRMADVSGTSYVDTDVSPSYNYTYTVRCVTSDGSRFMSDYDNKGFNFFLCENPVITSTETRLDGIMINVWAQSALVRIYRKTAGGSWKRIAQIDTQEDSSYRDTDVEAGKTYYYTARAVNEKGEFLSWYDTEGTKHIFSRASCVPELEYVIYTGDNIALVKPLDNKFGITHFYLDTFNYSGEYIGSFSFSDEPVYIRSSDFEDCRRFYFVLAGTDAQGNIITSYFQSGQLAEMIPMPAGDTNIDRIGNREYRLRWDTSSGGYGYVLWFYAEEDESIIIDTGLLNVNGYTLDLSDYPEDYHWTCVRVKTDSAQLSYSLSVGFSFTEDEIE